MSLTNPIQLLRDFPIEESKEMLKDLKKELKTALEEEKDESGMVEILLHTINSLEKELVNVKAITSLSKEKQARILADMSLILQFLQAHEEFTDDEDFDDDEDEDFDEDEEE